MESRTEGPAVLPIASSMERLEGFFRYRRVPRGCSATPSTPTSTCGKTDFADDIRRISEGRTVLEDDFDPAQVGTREAPTRSADDDDDDG